MQANKSKEKTCDVYVICPVRNATEGENRRINDYIKNLESKGLKVFWSSRDNPHEDTDSVGLLICDFNREATFNAKEIHVFWNPSSTGSLFDLGMAFAFMRVQPDKKILLINQNDVGNTDKKSFNNVLLALNYLALRQQKRG